MKMYNQENCSNWKMSYTVCYEFSTHTYGQLYKLKLSSSHPSSKEKTYAYYLYTNIRTRETSQQRANSLITRNFPQPNSFAVTKISSSTRKIFTTEPRKQSNFLPCTSYPPNSIICRSNAFQSRIFQLNRVNWDYVHFKEKLESKDITATADIKGWFVDDNAYHTFVQALYSQSRLPTYQTHTQHA